jgi:hypothetical protein
MTLIPPVAAAQAGSASGGGLLDTFKNAIGGATGGATGATQEAPKGDGSVGLFDGVLKKALFGGAAGVAMGFIPFLPGGPVLGGILGALGGAAMGVFSNWSKMKAIKQENEAMLAEMGVQADDPQIKQVLQSGNVSQLIPMMQQQGAGVQQGAGAGAGAGVGQSTGVGQGSGGTPTQQNIQWMTDPATGKSQLIDLSTGTVLQEGDASQTGTQVPQAQSSTQLPAAVDPSAAAAQSPVPTQGAVQVGSGVGGGAINPNAAVNPGVAPALQGGGGSSGDAGRPPAPVGVNSSDVSAIAPTQAGIGTSAPQAAAGVETLQVDTEHLDRSQLSALIAKLQQQIDQLKAYLAEQERSEQLDKAAAR